MNFIKAQTSLLKEWNSNKPGVHFGKYDDKHIAFTLDGYCAVIVPNDLFLLDPAKTKRSPINSFSEMGIFHPENTAPWFATGIRKQIGKDMTVELKDKGGNVKYISEKLLKIFDDRKCTITFLSTTRFSSPVFIDTPPYGTVGLIMPIIVKKEGI